MWAVAYGATVAWGHGGSSHVPPLPPRPEQTELDQDRVHDVRWSWLHWWEANRNRLLRSATQGDGRQPPDPAMIEKLRADATDSLRASLRSEYPPLRTMAALALGRLDADATAEDVRTVAEKDGDADAARAATLALGMLATPEARDFVIEHSYADLERRIAGCAALGLLPDVEADLRRKMQSLLKQPPEIGTVGAWSLTQHAEADNLASFERALRAEESPWLASQLLLSLGEHGDPKSLKLLTLVATTDPRRISGTPLTRYAAWDSLNDRQIAAERLIVQTRAKAARDRLNAPDALKRYHEAWREIDPNSPRLQEGVLERTVRITVGRERIYLERLRASAAIALGMLDLPAAEAPLVELLKERDNGYNHVPQGFAAMALGERGSVEAAPVLVAILSPRSERDHLKTQEELEHPIRGFAALALGLYARQEQTPQGPADRPATEKVLQLLAERLADDREELEVRTAAALALGLSGRSDALPVMRTLRDRMAQQDDVLVGYLLLGRGLLGDVEVLQDVQGILGGGDRLSMSGVLGQRAAVLALGVLGRDEAIPLLTQAWHANHYVSREVIVALRLAQAYGVCDQLNTELRNAPRPTVQQFMAEALGEMLQADSAKSLQPFVANTNYTMKNVRMLPFQRLANVFLFDYLIPGFGENWL